LLGTAVDQRNIMRATFVWDLPDLPASTGARRAMALILNDWRLSGVWSGATGGAYSIDYAYSNNGTPQILTGSPDFPARTIIVGDPGNGCSSDRFSQFNTAAFVGPTPGSVGLESGAGYLRGCFLSTLDLAVTRMFRLGGSRSFQVRVEMFNAPNSAIITGRQATMNLANPSSNTVITNLPYDQNGNLIDARSRPRGAGFGVANVYQSPRAVQLQLRFAF
jgi:hypothetical protein